MKKFAFLILSVIVALGLGTIFLYTDTFLLEEIDIESNWIPSQEILLGASISEGQNLFFLNKIDLVKKIKDDPRVDEVDFKKVYPNKLLIRVKGKQPILEIEEKDKRFLVDENKHLISLDSNYPDLPVLKGFKLGEIKLGQALDLKNEELFNNAMDLAQLCNQAEMGEIFIWEEKGFIFLHLGEGFKAAFGKGDEIEKKFNNFYAIFEDLKEKNINKGTINLTNPESPTFLPFD